MYTPGLTTRTRKRGPHKLDPQTNKQPKEDFETPFLEATRVYYRAESQSFIARNTCPDYMLKVRNGPC